jgi:hypothetical protein
LNVRGTVAVQRSMIGRDAHAYISTGTPTREPYSVQEPS